MWFLNYQICFKLAKAVFEIISLKCAFQIYCVVSSIFDYFPCYLLLLRFSPFVFLWLPPLSFGLKCSYLHFIDSLVKCFISVLCKNPVQIQFKGVLLKDKACVVVCVVCARGSVLSHLLSLPPSCVSSPLSTQKDDVWEGEWVGPVYQGGRARAGREEIQRHDLFSLSLLPVRLPLSHYALWVFALTLSYLISILFAVTNICSVPMNINPVLLTAQSLLKYLTTSPLKKNSLHSSLDLTTSRIFIHHVYGCFLLD